jgi:MGT family glycosyltransferase
MHYLVPLWDGGGTVPVELGVVRRLLARGQTVTVLGDPSIEAEAAATGAEFRPWVRAPHRRSKAMADDLVKDWETRNPFTVMARIRSQLVTGPAELFAAEVREALAARPAEAVVASGMLLGALIGAESMGVPVAALVPNVYTRPAEGIPPLGMGLQPATGPLGRARDRVLTTLGAALWRPGLPDLNAARAAYGLDPLDEVWQQWDHATCVVVLTPQFFDFPGTLPANVRYVGPVLDDPAWAEPVEPPPGDEPLVVVGLSSTYMRQEELLRRIVRALGDLPVRAVVTTGPAVDPADVPGSERVRVVRSASHAQLFGMADVVVTHAGHGTLMKALAAGVPTLCLPMGRDQPDNVTRAARLGATLALKPTASSAQIAAGVRRLLEEPSYRDSARAVGERVRAEAASPALVEELEAVVVGGTRSATSS